jgi:alpha-glucosidase
LEYLQGTLGVSALYLNPVFTSPSNHKYDTVDYFEVDRHLGGNDKLIELRQATKERGLKLVLDAVLNHTSAHHPFMDRYGEHGSEGAFANKESAHRGQCNTTAVVVLGYCCGNCGWFVTVSYQL